jgi:hypothetical protein
VVPIGGTVLPSKTGPTLPSGVALSASHCGYQVPDGAIVRKDGSVVGVSGNALTANMVCSDSDVATGTSHGIASNVQAPAAIASPNASIQAPNIFTIQETFQEAPAYPPSGWYSYTSTIQVPDIEANPQPTIFRWYAGVLSDSGQQESAVIAGTLEWIEGFFTAFGMLEPGPGSANTYTQPINVNPDDVLVVTVQEAPSQDTWTVSVTDQTQNVTKSMSVSWGPALPWAVDVMDAHEQSGAALASCGELPFFFDMHFGSPHLFPDQNSQRKAGNVVPYNPGYFQINNGQPQCQWSDFVQADNGNQSGFTDLIWSCSPSYSCGACGTAQVNCTGDLVSCGGCPSGQSCTLNACVASCTPTTCSAQRVSCGSIGDGCGGTLDCGSCSGSRATCTGGSCQCTGASCANLGESCGTWSNGCGGLVTCGPPCATQAAPAMPPFGVASLLLMLGGFGVVFARREGLGT